MKSALIEITSRCNLSCKHCFNNSGGNTGYEIELPTLISSIQQLESIGFERITLTGGEPLLHSELDGILDYIATSQTKFIFNTNGTITCPRLVELHTKCSNVFFQVSLDGATPQTNDYIRGVGSFEKTLHFLKKTVPQRSTIKITLNRNNAHELKDFFELSSSLNITPHFGYVMNSGRAANNWENLGLSSADVLLLVKELEKYSQEHGLDIRNYRLGIFHQCPINSCQSPSEVFINYIGDIFPCGMLTTKAFILGNIYSSCIKEIVSNRNPRYSTIQQIIAQRQNLFMLQYCNTCPVAKTGFCLKDGGCLGEDLNMCFDEGLTCLLKKKYVMYHGLQNYLLNNGG